VTHLPQVAAFADRHLQVVKATEGVKAGSVTRSGVVALTTRSGSPSCPHARRVDTGLARGHAESCSPRPRRTARLLSGSFSGRPICAAGQEPGRSRRNRTE
jgi:DNA repair protein RecN (Recombination protein N)